jgi:hypothetical protein
VVGQGLFRTFPSTIQQSVQASRRRWAVTSPTPAALLPGVPTMAKFLPGF